MIKKILLIFISALIFVSCSASVISPILDAEAIKYGIDISQEDNLIKEQIKTKLKEYKQAYGKNKVIFIGTPKADYLVSASLTKLTLEAAKELYIQNVTIDISKVYFNERKIKSSMCRGGVYVGYFELSFILPENSIRVIEGNAFSLNNYLKEVTIPDSVIGIDSTVFQLNYKLEKITISKDSKLEYIGYDAFANCPIKEILIPASVTSIGSSPFSDSLTTVTYLGTKPNTIMNNKDVFEDCVNLTTLIIPNAEDPADPAWKTFLGGSFNEVRK